MSHLPLQDFGLRVQPMVHVADMGSALDFYAALGGRLVFGSRDGDWALVAFAETQVALLAHPPGDGRRETVELHFTAAVRLEQVEEHLRLIDPTLIDRGVADEAFGRMLKVVTPDGLLIKLIELERDVIE